MSESATFISVVGARPQFVKLAPISRAFDKIDGVNHLVVHTGQHYDKNMSETFFDQLEMRAPDALLNVGSGSHGAQTASMLTSLETYFAESCADVVLTYGDTNSTLAATLSAAKMHIRVAHIEAGLRSFNRNMPEEINRLVADHCSDDLYAPTPLAMQNLANENLSSRAVLSGDVMLDAVHHNIELARMRSHALEEHGLTEGKFGLVTVHRPSNTTGDALRELVSVLAETANKHLPLVFPVHPRTRLVLNEIGFVPPDSMSLVDPLPYLDNLTLIKAAALVLTDSGGVQKEAAFLSTPCLTMRDETEWVETVELGLNRLVGNAGVGLINAIEEVLAAKNIFHEKTIDSLKEHYGDGSAAELIVNDSVNRLA